MAKSKNIKVEVAIPLGCLRQAGFWGVYNRGESQIPLRPLHYVVFSSQMLCTKLAKVVGAYAGMKQLDTTQK
jgi:hypothetical protein